MAGSWRSEVRRVWAVSWVVLLGALLVADALGAPEPLRVEQPVRRLGRSAGYVTCGRVTKPVLKAGSSGRVEIDLNGVPAGRLHLAAGIPPGKRRLSGRFSCTVSVAG